MEVKKRGATAIFCGVREEFARALHNVSMQQWLPDEHLFLEEPTTGSATLHAVRKAYEILGAERCPTCPRRESEDREVLYYMI